MAQRLRPVLTYAVPHLAAQARIELARAHLALADVAGARTLMREVDALLRRRPTLGTLADQAQALRTQLSKERGSAAPGASALTDAELRLLPLLATHLTFPEIGQELFLSRNTVKTQANSIYRKLGASTRSQAVTRAREVGLLDAPAASRQLRMCGRAACWPGLVRQRLVAPVVEDQWLQLGTVYQRDNLAQHDQVIAGAVRLPQPAVERRRGIDEDRAPGHARLEGHPVEHHRAGRAVPVGEPA